MAVMSVTQVSRAAGGKSQEKVTVIRMAAPSTFQPAPVQKKAVVNTQADDVWAAKTVLHASMLAPKLFYRVRTLTMINYL